MASKKDNLPLSLVRDDDSSGSITYANEVIAIIAGVAANEVEGIAGMCSGGGFSDVFVRSRNIKKGVKVEIGEEEASVDLYVIVEYGTPIQDAAQDVQENVRKAIETMTGLHVVRVDVHVNGVSFEKEKLELEAGLENAMLGDSDNSEDKSAVEKTSADTRKKRMKPVKQEPVVTEKTEPDVKAEPAKQAETKPEPVAKAEPVKQTETKPEPKAKAESVKQAETKPEPKAKAESVKQAETKPEPKEEHQASAKAEVKAEPKVTEKAEVKPEAKTAAKTETKAETKAEPQTKAEDKTKANKKNEVKTTATAKAAPRRKPAAKAKTAKQDDRGKENGAS